MEAELLAKAEREHWWFQARKSIIADLFWKKYSQIKRPSILSVGASTGSEFEYLSTFGEVTGIDIDKQVVQICRNRGLRVVHGDILSCDLPRESFDVIFAMDVLEHIVQDSKALTKIMQLLKPNGYLVATVPACQFLWGKLDEVGDFPHVRRYNKKSFKNLLLKQPLKITKLSYFNFFLFPLAYCVRKLVKNPSTEMHVPVAPINMILRGIFTLEKFFLRWMNLPIGVSLIAICQKK